MKIIDFHTHIFPPDIIRQREHYLDRDAWFQLLYANPRARMVHAEELVASLDEAGIDIAVTFGFAWADPALCQLSNDYVCEAMERHQGRLIGFAVVNPASGQLAVQEAERCALLGFRGIGELMPDGQGYALDDRDTMKTLLEWTIEHHFPLLVHASEPVGHTYKGKDSTTPEVIYRLAQDFPKALVICAHWGGGLPFYELMPEVRQALANVYYDTAASPFLYDGSIFPLAAQIVGDKILFATDYPLIGQRRFLRHVRESGLTSMDLERILGGNAQKLLSPVR